MIRARLRARFCPEPEPKPNHEARAAVLALRRALAGAHQPPSVSRPLATLSRIYAIRDDEAHQP